MTRSLADAHEGKGKAVVVTGDRGVGKSRIVQHFLDTEVNRDWTVFTIRGTPDGLNVPSHPMARLLRAWARVEERDFQSDISAKVYDHIQGLGRDLMPLLPAIDAVLDLPVLDAGWGGLEPVQRRERIVVAVSSVIMRAAFSPTVFVVEDAEWLDSETLAILDTMMDSLQARRMLMIVTCEDAATLGWSDRHRSLQCRLDRLTPDESDHVLVGLFGDDPGSAPVRRQVRDAADGVPLFLEIAVRALLDDDTNVPASARAGLATRIGRLTDRARWVLQCAASLGFETSKTILASATGLGDEELNLALGELATAGLVGVVRTGPDIVIVFPNADAHAAAAQVRSAETDRDALVRAIEAIETGRLNRLDEHIELLARFALNSESWDKAAEFCRRAGEKAQGRAAAPEVVSHLESALTALARLPKSREIDEQTFHLRLALPEAYRAMGRFDHMMAHLHEAQTLATAMADPARRATVKVYQTNVQNLLGQFDDAVVAGRHALELAEAVGNPALIGGAYAALGQSYLFSCDSRRLIDVFSRYLAYIDGGGEANKTEQSDAASIFCLAHIATARALLGDFVESKALIEKACELADTIGQPHIRKLALGVAGVTAVIQGDVESAMTCLDQALAIGDAADSHRLYSLLAGHLGYAYALAGRSGEARDLLDKALANARREHLPYDEAWSTAFLGHACLVDEDLEHAVTYGEAALELARGHHFRAVEAWVLRLLGSVCSVAVLPDPTRAENYLRQALALSETLEMRPDIAHCWLALGKLHFRTGRFAEARRETDTALELYHVMGMGFWVTQAKAVSTDLSERVA